MKNALLALALLAFIGSAAAHEKDGKDKDKKGAKKEACSAEAKAHCGGAGASTSLPTCCAKKGASATSTTAPAAKPAEKSL